MRLLFSLTYYSPYISGLTIIVKNLAEEMARKKHAVTVLCMKHEANLKAAEIINEVQVTRVKPMMRISKGFISPEWVGKTYAAVKECDTAVINLPQFEGWVVAAWAKMMGKRIIANYLSEISLPPGGINYLVQKSVEMINRLVLRWSDKIITYSEDYGKNSRLLKKYINKCVYIYPPIRVPRMIKQEKDKLIKKIGKADLVIGMAARLAREKGVEYLLETIPLLKKALHKKIKVVIAGPTDPVGEEKYKRKITEIINMYPGEVILLGTVPERGMGAFYRCLDMLVLPSANSTEAFGMVQVEAMMMGVPVIASDLPGVRVPIRLTGMGIIAAVKNPQALSEAIIKIAGNRDAYVIEKEAVVRLFDHQASVNAYEKILFNK